jgi:hypothetical protein
MSTFKTDYQIPNRQRVTIDDEALTVDLSDDRTIQNSRWAGFITVQRVGEATPNDYHHCRPEPDQGI